MKNTVWKIGLCAIADSEIFMPSRLSELLELPSMKPLVSTVHKL